jgi:hypothetical protein
MEQRARVVAAELGDLDVRRVRMLAKQLLQPIRVPGAYRGDERSPDRVVGRARR